MLETVRKREALLKSKSESIPNLPDFGFYNDPSVVETLYWERRNSDYQLNANEGGLLEQDSQLSLDMSTVHEVVMWAEAIVKGGKGEPGSDKPPPVPKYVRNFDDL